MKRRRYLMLAGGATVGLAGCSTGPNSTPTESPTPTASPTSTPEPTPSPTPSPQPPSIDEVSLVSRWFDFGDVEDHQVNAVGRGAPANVGFRYHAEVHDGQSDVTQQVRIFDESGSRVAMDEVSDDQLTDSEGYQSWEHVLQFETDQWDLGDYEAEVIVRDNVIGANSSPKTASFTVNEPLTGSEGTLVDVEGPGSVSTGERYEYTLEIENSGTRDGSIVTPVSARYESDDEWFTYDFTVSLTIGQEETNTWSGYFNGFDYSGTVIFRLDDIDETWRVDVTE